MQSPPRTRSLTAPLFLALVLAWGIHPAHAGTLGGVTVPDSVTVGGQSLVLNGMGLREKVVIDVYVGSLYLPAKTGDAKRAIEEDVPKRLTMSFIYSEVGQDQLVEAYEEGLDKDPAKGSVQADFQKMYAMLSTVHSGDEIVFDYVPGTGTTVTVKGAKKGTIAGVAFMRSLWRVYLGSEPPSAALKKGMLGG